MRDYKESKLTITLPIGDWESISACLNESLESPREIVDYINRALNSEYRRLGLFETTNSD